MRRSILPALVLALAFPSSASAQDVMVDPDSPGGAEYDIPMERERDEADPDGGKRKEPGDRSAPAFGEGIKRENKRRAPARSVAPAESTDTEEAPAAVAGSSGGGGGDGSGGRDRGENGDRKAAAVDLRPPDAKDSPGQALQPASASDTSEPGSTGFLLALGLGALALVVGLSVGIVIRRRRSFNELDDAAASG